jgi:hypothetical protein
VIFSYNLVLALFLLAPGFAGFAGLYLASQLGRVKSQPMPPGSVLALALVTVSALAAHAIAASLFWAQRAFCDAFACIHLPVDPDPYAVFLAQGRGLSLAGDAQIALALLNLFGLTVFTFVVARLAGGWLSSLPAMRGLLYGWLADVVPAESRISGDGAAEVFMAYVLSDLEDGGVVVGYEGAVANLTTDAEREINSVLLTGCETFRLHISRRGVFRREVERSSAIPQIYLHRSRIHNIAFERIRIG